MPSPDVVVLVPGFLGFSRFGGLYYFSERIVAVLRGVLEERLGSPVQVVPCTTHPTESLAQRQLHLVEYLNNLCAKTLKGVKHIYLIGHSSGGVDAQLLACTKPLGGRAWNKKANDVRRKIKSVVTISAPHYGTRLADSWLGYWAENPFASWAPIIHGIKLGYHALRLVPQELPAVQRLQLERDLIIFLAKVAFHRGLIADLRPVNMEKLRKILKPEPGIALTCFVTGTQLPARRKFLSDSFFTEMYDLTKGDGKKTAAVESCQHLLQGFIKSKPDLVIRSQHSRMPDIHAKLNDGVINTIRQVVDPNDRSQLGGFVVADHADVLGHYDRQDSLIEGAPYNPGLFHSGAGFGDDEFFKLYRLVAEAVLR